MNFFRTYIIVLCFLLMITKLFSQTDNAVLNMTTKDSVYKKESPEKDIFDVLKLKRLAGDAAIPGSLPIVIGDRKPRITVIPFVGYTLQTRLAGIIAGSIPFYTDNDAQTNQSAISISISYSQNNQMIAPLLSNIWSKKNRYNFLGNWRIYKYPEQTYGLGGHTTEKQKTKLEYSYFLFREAVLKHISSSAFYAGLGYNLSYHSHIAQSSIVSSFVTDFDVYGRTKSSVSSGISFHTLFDNRGNTINPRKGAYANITYYQYAKLAGSDNNWQAVIIDLRKYFPIGKSKNILAFWSYNWFTSGKTPYLDLPSTGWDTYSNIGRGYIQSRLRGRNLLYLEAEYRFKLTPGGFLGGVLFTNAQSVSDWPSNKFTTLSPAVGTGLRIKINKFSGTNLSIDYGFGLDGSRGLFVNLGEIF